MPNSHHALALPAASAVPPLHPLLCPGPTLVHLLTEPVPTSCLAPCPVSPHTLCHAHMPGSLASMNPHVYCRHAFRLPATLYPRFTTPFYTSRMALTHLYARRSPLSMSPAHLTHHAFRPRAATARCHARRLRVCAPAAPSAMSQPHLTPCLDRAIHPARTSCPCN